MTERLPPELPSDSPVELSEQSWRDRERARAIARRIERQRRLAKRPDWDPRVIESRLRGLGRS